MLETTNVYGALTMSWTLCSLLGINSERTRSSWDIQAEMTEYGIVPVAVPPPALCVAPIHRLDTLHEINNIALVGLDFTLSFL